MNPTERDESNSTKNMSADAVVHLLQLFEQQGMKVVVDGGWGIDALLGEQTHVHADLDIAISHNDIPKLRALLTARGYKDVPHQGTWECNFVMGDEQGHEVDIHSYLFDAQGTLVFGVAYPLDSLTGRGTILGYPVPCISAEWTVQFHSGYELDENDYRDVSAVCRQFGIPLPSEYKQFTQDSAE